MMSELTQQAPKVGILDYGMGNLRSVHRAFIAVGADARIVQHTQEMEDCQALVFPGQGAIVDTMRLLEDREWVPFIRAWLAADRPFFGICLGMQALFDFSEEGATPGLGILPGKVQRFRFDPETGLKIPHMGWNQVKFTVADAMVQGIDPAADRRIPPASGGSPNMADLNSAAP